MVEIVIKKFWYIKDIPVELLGKAVEAGELRRGKFVGLQVQLDSGDKAFIELRLMLDGQEKLIREGQAFSVEQVGGIFVMDSSWGMYLEKASAVSRSP
jgi:hypothetical protein